MEISLEIVKFTMDSMINLSNKLSLKRWEIQILLKKVRKSKKQDMLNFYYQATTKDPCNFQRWPLLNISHTIKKWLEKFLKQVQPKLTNKGWSKNISF